MPRYRTFPDTEAVVSLALRTAPLVTGLSDRVYSSIPKNPTYPLVVVKRIGGTPVERHALDRATIQVEAWGNTQSEIHDIAAAVRVKIHELEGNSFTHPNLPAAVFITAVRDVLGLLRVPDAETGRDRYIFSVNVFIHGE